MANKTRPLLYLHNIPSKPANICNILPRSAVSNGSIEVKLKRDLKCKARAYFEPACSQIVYQQLSYLKFYEDISIAKGLSKEDMFKFFHIVDIQGQSECVTEKMFLTGKK